jgi:hypothetical protein
MAVDRTVVSPKEALAISLKYMLKDKSICLLSICILLCKYVSMCVFCFVSVCL